MLKKELHMKMKAMDFLERFAIRTANLISPGKAPDWTRAIYEPLTNIATDPPFSFEVRAKTMEDLIDEVDSEAPRPVKRKGELHLIDFVYSLGCDQKNTWHPPMVVIEHENVTCRRTKKGGSKGRIRRLEKLREDFWKVCLYVAPLRVIIGYGRDRENIEHKQVAYDGGCELIGFYDEWGLRQMPDSETLLLMGWRQSIVPREWHFWIKRGNERWKEGSASARDNRAQIAERTS
jgi:hypothetical protein